MRFSINPASTWGATYGYAIRGPWWDPAAPCLNNGGSTEPVHIGGGVYECTVDSQRWLLAPDRRVWFVVGFLSRSGTHPGDLSSVWNELWAYPSETPRCLPADGVTVSASLDGHPVTFSNTVLPGSPWCRHLVAP